MMTNTNEFVSGLEVIAKDVCGVLANGKVDAGDFTYLVDALTKFQTIVEGFKSIPEIGPEFKDPSEQDLIALGLRVYTIVKECKKIIADNSKTLEA